MDWLLATIIVVGMFSFRLAVPLVTILIIGYLLNRLDTKWQADAET